METGGLHFENRACWYIVDGSERGGGVVPVGGWTCGAEVVVQGETQPCDGVYVGFTPVVDHGGGSQASEALFCLELLDQREGAGAWLSFIEA